MIVTLCTHFIYLWRVTGNLGSGEFGSVYKGRWHSPGGPINVAIKTLKQHSADEDRVRFLQEAAIMGQFHHPNVVKLHGVVTMKEPVSWRTKCNPDWHPWQLLQ